MLELPGAVFLLGWRGTPEGGGIGPGVDAGGGVFEVLWGGWRGTPEKGGIGPGVDGWMQSGVFLRF